MPDRAAPPVESPAYEFEITPDMVEMGVRAYYENAIWGWENPGDRELRSLLASVYTAMASSARKTK